MINRKELYKKDFCAELLLEDSVSQKSLFFIQPSRADIKKREPLVYLSD